MAEPCPAPPLILLVDDDRGVRDLLAEQIEALGYRALTAASGEAALALLEDRRPDLILTDVNMDGLSGVGLCARVKADPRFQLTPVVLLTAVADLDARVAGLDAGADDFFAKPWELPELSARLRVLLRVKMLMDQLEQAENVITTLGLTIEARDPYTGGHCERLARYAVRLGQALGASQPTLKALWLGGFLHDLGKIAVPDTVLLKPGPLAPDERARIRRHPADGEELVRGLKTLQDVRPIIRHHHERWDGSGYPDGLRGEAIPLGARIMAVVDVYDALSTQRPYKPALTPARARAVLREEAERGSWEPRIVAAFIDLLPALAGAERRA